MSEQPPSPATAGDFSNQLGFNILRAINRLDDKIENVRTEQKRTAEALRQEIGGIRQEIGGVRQEIGGVRQEIGGVRQEIGGIRQEIHTLDLKYDQKIDKLDSKFDQKLNTLQYWYWGTLVGIIVAFVTLLFLRP